MRKVVAVNESAKMRQVTSDGWMKTADGVNPAPCVTVAPDRPLVLTLVKFQWSCFLFFAAEVAAMPLGMLDPVTAPVAATAPPIVTAPEVVTVVAVTSVNVAAPLKSTHALLTPESLATK